MSKPPGLWDEPSDPAYKVKVDLEGATNAALRDPRQPYRDPGRRGPHVIICSVIGCADEATHRHRVEFGIALDNLRLPDDNLCPTHRDAIVGGRYTETLEALP